MQRIKNFLLAGDVYDCLPGESVGAEIETSLINQSDGQPISLDKSQQIMSNLLESGNWQVEQIRGHLLSALLDGQGNKICYELGRQNFELATIPWPVDKLLSETKQLLAQLYRAADQAGAEPFFGPVLPSEENLLIIPDERDADWLKLDGHRALEFLSRISAVQFTVAVEPARVVKYLNNLADKMELFLDGYPQHVNWLGYIAGSKAGYRRKRYGGPLHFADIDDYVKELSYLEVIRPGTRLSLREPLVNMLPLSQVDDLDVSLHLRSIWWHFRLKRYGHYLCIEVRPIGRRSDEQLDEQLQLVMSCFG